MSKPWEPSPLDGPVDTAFEQFLDTVDQARTRLGLTDADLHEVLYRRIGSDVADAWDVWCDEDEQEQPPVIVVELPEGADETT